jgi:nucleoside-diphosphate-sugar epimerase
MKDLNDVLVVGAGYLGKEVARLSIGRGATVYATTRHPSRFAPLRRLGAHPIQFDWNDPSSYANLPWRRLSPEANVLVAVSYDRHSRIGRYESQVGGLARFLSVLPPSARLCYISTTGVYHQTGGEWVDETSPTFPRREGGRAHLLAEARLHAVRPRSPWLTLRLAGIYGPERVPRAGDVIAGRAIASPEAGYLNLIHVHDAARATLAAWRLMADASALPASPTERLYVVGDDAPVIRGEFYREIARQCGAPPPHFVAPSAGASVRMRSESNKRVWNRKMHRDLLPSLVFPDHRSGLADVLRRTLD